MRRIERKQNVELDISNKMLDYSAVTIIQLIQDWYDDTINNPVIGIVIFLSQLCITDFYLRIWS